MTTMEIKDRWSGKVLWSCEAETLRDAVEAAIGARANLDGANLAGANLARANLAGANLAGANLDGANLDGANLAGANLARAYLARAYLARAYLAGANLAGANLAGANLAGANLDGANLDGANLAGALPHGSDFLRPYRDDICKVLDAAPAEVGGLLELLWQGKVDGTVYEGECACLVGSIAKVRKCNYNAIPGLMPDSDRPAERWFMNIHKGDRPDTNPAAAFAAAVIARWMFERGQTVPPTVKPKTEAA